jgi:hypothetical protein
MMLARLTQQPLRHISPLIRCGQALLQGVNLGYYLGQ